MKLRQNLRKALLAVFLFSGTAPAIADREASTDEFNRRHEVVLDEIRRCAKNQVIVADDGISDIGEVSGKVKLMCSVVFSRIYSEYKDAGFGASTGATELLKTKQMEAIRVIRSAVSEHRAQMLERRNGEIGDRARSAAAASKECAARNAEDADDYISDAKTIAVQLSNMCKQEYDEFVTASSIMLLEDEGQRRGYAEKMNDINQRIDLFLPYVIKNRKAAR